jgi:hypothetical protein
VRESFIREAYDHATGRIQNDDILEARMFQHPRWESKRGFLEALLLLPDLRLDEVAARIGISVSVVMVYENLFWNVRDRLQDNCFMSAIAFPNTRLVEFKSDYWETANPRQLMIRSGFNGDFDAIMQIFGSRAKSDELSVQASANSFKSCVLAEADFVIRAGGANSKMPLLETARKLIEANDKNTGRSRQSQADEMGLTAIGLTDPGASILEHLRLANDDSDYERKLALQEAQWAVVGIGGGMPSKTR